MNRDIIFQHPNTAPLTAFLSKAKEPNINPGVRWFEEQQTQAIPDDHIIRDLRAQAREEREAVHEWLCPACRLQARRTRLRRRITGRWTRPWPIPRAWRKGHDGPGQ